MATQNYFKVKNGLEIPSFDALYATDVAAPSVRPSLDLNFASTKKLDPRITFARSSTAAYYDGKSVVKAEENLIINSSSPASAVSLATKVDGQSSPDGGTTASLITADGSSGVHFVYSYSATYLSSTYTISVCLKKNTQRYVQVFFNAIYSAVNVDLDTGVTSVVSGATNVVSSSSISIGNGWYKIVITTNYPYTGSNIWQVAVNSLQAGYYQTNTESGSWYIWAPQIEQRSYATAYTATTGSAITNYIPTMQTAATNTARFDHDPVTGESKGLLIEEQRTNLLGYSQNISTPQWSFYAPMSLYAANAFIAPDSTQSAHILTTTNGGSIYKDTAVSGTGTYAVSIYVHTSSSCTNANLAFFFTGSSTQNFGVTFNPATGTYISSGASNGATILGYSVVSVGNGWYRISVSGTGSNSGNTTGRVQLYSNIATQNTIAIWGAQLEAGAFATSYIPTPLTYTGRASTATYRATDGLIRIAGNDQARYEPNAAGGSNLLLEVATTNVATTSDQMTGWSVMTQLKSVANCALAPDGSYSASKLTETITSTGEHGVYLPRTGSNETMTLSVYVKAAERTSVRIGFSNFTSAGIGVTFNLSNATVTVTPVTNSEYTNPIYSINDVGGGWYRCIFTVTKAAVGASNNAYIEPTIAGNASYAGEPGKGLYVWGAQVETGSTATSYIPSTETHTGRSSTATYYDSTGTIRTAASGQPRYTYNPSLLTAAPKLLLEAQATNLLTTTDTLSGWELYLTTITANATTAPDGTTSASKFVPNTTNGNHWFRLRPTYTLNTVYTLSVYVKASDYYNLYLGTNGNAGIKFNAQTGAITTQETIDLVSYYAQPLPNNWWRLVMTIKWTAGDSFIMYVQNNSGVTTFAGDGTSGIYVWGAQLETGYAATSYISSGASAVTRAADTSTSAAGSRAADVYSSSQVTRAAETASITGTNFSSWYSNGQGTLHAVYTDNDGTGTRALNIRNAAGTKYIDLVSGSGTGAGGYWNVTAVSGEFNGSSVQANEGVQFNTAFAWNTNDYVEARAGAITQTNATLTMTQDLNSMYIGNSGGSAQITGNIKRIVYYPKRLSNAELQALTTQ